MRGRHQNYGDEPVMVWGWDSRAQHLIRMTPGMAEPLRQACREGSIVCPLAGCSDPELTTRRGYVTGRGTVVVDGFRHRVAPTPGHAPESVSHITAKLLIADWLRIDGWDVGVERTDARTLRRPDVHAVKGDAMLAVEVQYSSLPYSQWKQRTTDLASVGYTVVWLWGVPAPAASVELTAIHQGQLSAGQRLWWIDAAGRRLGVPLVRSGTFERSPVSGDRSVRVEWVDLDEVAAGRDGFGHTWCEVLDATRRLQRERLLDDLHGGLNELLLLRSAPKPVRQPVVVQVRDRQPGLRWETPVPRLTVDVELPPIDWSTASARERCDWYREAGRRATAALEAARFSTPRRHSI